MVVMKRMTVSQRKWLAKKFHIKETVEIFHDIVIGNDEMLETDQNLEKSMAIFQDIEKILAPYCK